MSYMNIHIEVDIKFVFYEKDYKKINNKKCLVIIKIGSFILEEIIKLFNYIILNKKWNVIVLAEKLDVLSLTCDVMPYPIKNNIELELNTENCPELINLIKLEINNIIFNSIIIHFSDSYTSKIKEIIIDSKSVKNINITNYRKTPLNLLYIKHNLNNCNIKYCKKINCVILQNVNNLYIESVKHIENITFKNIKRLKIIESTINKIKIRKVIKEAILCDNNFRNYDFLKNKVEKGCILKLVDNKIINDYSVFNQFDTGHLCIRYFNTTLYDLHKRLKIVFTQVDFPIYLYCLKDIRTFIHINSQNLYMLFKYDIDNGKIQSYQDFRRNLELNNRIYEPDSYAIYVDTAKYNLYTSQIHMFGYLYNDFINK